jgi:hypothetical protein
MNYALSKVTHLDKGSYSSLKGKLLTSGGKVGEGYKQTIPATHVVTETNNPRHACRDGD